MSESAVISFVAYRELAPALELAMKMTSSADVKCLITLCGVMEPDVTIGWEPLKSDGSIMIKRTSDNVGYSAGHNSNFCFASREFGKQFRFIITNNDLVYEGRLSDFCESIQPGLIVAPVIKFTQSDSKRFGRSFDPYFARNKWLLKNEANPDWVSGCFFGVHSFDFSKIMFRDDFFLYSEDLLYCLIAKTQNDLSIVVLEDLEVIHESEKFDRSMAKKNFFRTLLSFKNNKKIFWEYDFCNLSYIALVYLRLFRGLAKCVILSRVPLRYIFFAPFLLRRSNKEIVEFIHSLRI